MDFIGEEPMKAQTYWEYKYVYNKSRTNREDKIEGMLNELGNQGWELVSVVDAGEGVNALIHAYVFKRPRLE